MKRKLHTVGKMFMVGAACVALGGIVGPAVAGDGRCYVARVDGRVMLPDGTPRDVASVRVCEERYSPAMALHEVAIDGRSVGRFLSRVSSVAARGVGPDAVLVFGRSEAGLHWIGYVERDGERARVFEFHGGRRAGRPVVEVDWNVALHRNVFNTEPQGEVFYVAALTRR